ncbi:hypothetical protein [Rhizobium leguminosarum]|uniref:hypothetical protein n=1 Tax=Rhizobium leguminosarum TaxID=384 RepID=UPI0014415ED7|nr:hypothetical protein [Rhizobium leguminosarum]NKK77698.1 hypothetical protein [Rhizobium leguminosarum bv. viciae]
MRLLRGDDLQAIVVDASQLAAGQRVPVSFTDNKIAMTATAEVIAKDAADQPELVYQASRLLFAMLVMAIILESALAVIFGWRVFLEFFDGRGVRTVVMFASAYVLVKAFSLDFVSQLLAIYGVPATSTAGTVLLTSLVLAGGSASVNALMVALGVRQNRRAEDVERKPGPSKAWVSISVQRKAAQGPVEVLRSEVDAIAGDAALVGVVSKQTPASRLLKYFWRDLNRVPRSAGLELDPAKCYQFVLAARGEEGHVFYRDVSGADLTKTGEGFEPTPRAYRFAAGTVVDFVVQL